MIRSVNGQIQEAGRSQLDFYIGPVDPQKSVHLPVRRMAAARGIRHTYMYSLVLGMSQDHFLSRCFS